MGARREVAQSRSLAAKLALLILLAAFMGVSLLSARQRRLVAAHDLAVLHAQAEEDGRTALRLRQEIADRLALPRIRMTAAEAGLKEPILRFESATEEPLAQGSQHPDDFDLDRLSN